MDRPSVYEATILGSLSTKQVFYVLRDKEGGTCWLGAVLAGIGSLSKEHCVAWAEPWYSTEISLGCSESEHRCPICQHSKPSLLYLGVHLNDAHRWSRPAIAKYLDWFIPVERELTPPQTTGEPLQIVDEGCTKPADSMEPAVV